MKWESFFITVSGSIDDIFELEGLSLKPRANNNYLLPDRSVHGWDS